MIGRRATVLLGAVNAGLEHLPVARDSDPIDPWTGGRGGAEAGFAFFGLQDDAGQMILDGCSLDYDAAARAGPRELPDGWRR